MPAYYVNENRLVFCHLLAEMLQINTVHKLPRACRLGQHCKIEIISRYLNSSSITTGFLK